MTSDVRPAVYARVSTDDKDQEPETQLVPLRAECERSEWPAPLEYVDRAAAGDFGRRTAWAQLLDDAHHRRFNLVLVYRLDRAFRSVHHGATTLELLRSLGVGIRSIGEPWVDTTTPYGEAMYHISVAWAGLETGILGQRTAEGMARAQRLGTRSGRAIGRPRVDGDSEQLLSMVDSGITTLSEQARHVGMSRETMRRRMSELGYDWSSENARWIAQDLSRPTSVGSVATVRTPKQDQVSAQLELMAADAASREQLDESVIAAVGITFGQIVVVNEIELAADQATVTALGAALGRAAHTLTSAINSLEKHGLVTRYKDRVDRRVIRIRLTPGGNKVLAKWREHRDEILESTITPNAGLAESEQRHVGAEVRAFDN